MQVRYVFALAVFPVLATAGLLLTAVAAPILDATITGTDLAMLAAVSLVLFSFVVALQFPIYFWRGCTKARLVAMLPFVGLVAVVVTLAPVLDSVTPPSPGMVVAVCVLGSAALLGLSVLLSTRLEARRVD